MFKPSILLKSVPFRVGCLVIVLCCAFYYHLSQVESNLLQALDAEIYNAMYRSRGEGKTSGKVAIVDIDEQSLARLGQWPWPRTVIADLVRKIQASGSAVIGLDMVFPEKDRTSPSNWLTHLESRHKTSSLPDISPLKSRLAAIREWDYDAVLGDALFNSSAVTGYAFTFEGKPPLTPPAAPFSSAHVRVSPPEISFGILDLPKAINAVLNIPEIAQGASEGFINFFPDAFGSVHKVPFFITLNKIPYPSLALETARLGLGATHLTLHAGAAGGSERPHAIIGISLDDRFIPTDTRGRIVLNYRGGVGRFPYHSAVDIMDGLPGTSLEGKIVLVGTSAAGLPDLRTTPFSSVFPGVEVHATIIDNILNGDPFQYDRYTEIGITFFLIIVVGFILNLVLAFAGPLLSTAAGFSFIFLSLWGNYSFFFLNNRLVGMVYPLATMLFLIIMVTTARFFYKDREKKFIQKAFSHYLSPKVVEQLMKEPDKLSLTGEQRELTVFFSDIRNFTTISEGMDTQRLAELLNLYLTAMSDIIIAHDGTVDKYIGDAVMALWGAPLHDSAHSVKALRSSLEMRSRLKLLNEKWGARGFPNLSIGIGLNTGVVSVGNFGSAQRFDYTVIGDNVNLAARLESLNKYYGTTILATEQTLKPSGKLFFSRLVDVVRVKGMQSAVRIFEPICEGPGDAESVEKALEFEAAVACYRSADFEKARKMFNRFEEREPTALNQVYLGRIDHYLKNPPDSGWDGVFTFSEK